MENVPCGTKPIDKLCLGDYFMALAGGPPSYVSYPVVNACSGQEFIDLLAKQPAGTFTKDILKFEPYLNNWWAMRVPQVDYPMHLGTAPLRRVASRQRGTEFPVGQVYTRSNATGSAADNIAAGLPVGTPAQAGCCPPVSPLNRGYLTRGLTTFNWGWASRPFCAKDFNQDLDPIGDLELEFEGYGEQIIQSKAVFQRNEYIRLCTTKVYARPGPGMFNSVVTSTVGDPNQFMNAGFYAQFISQGNTTAAAPYKGATAAYLGLDPTIKPTSQMTQSLGTQISQWLNANGVKGIAQLNGAQQYEFVTDPYTSENMLRDVSNFTIFNYADMGKGTQAALLQGLGSMQMYRNLAYQIDPYALAMDNNYDVIPSTITVTADSGTEDISNPAWYTAPYRISIFYTDHVFNVAYPKTASAPGGNVQFQGYDYLGDLRFKVLPEVPLGDQGYFYSEVLAASWAAQQRFGVVVIHLGCNATSFIDCSGVLVSYAHN